MVKLNSWFFVKTTVLLLALTLLTACLSQNGSETGNIDFDTDKALSVEGQSLIVFDTLEHDFGTIIEGEKLMCYFTYRNNGDAQLLLTSVKASCGCTTPDWSNEPLGPGKSEELKILFDASGRKGKQHKQITVHSNGGTEAVYLTIKANVINN